MQDKRIHIDEEFTTSAWAHMKGQLDQEMPVKDTGKSRIFWWWLCLVVVLGGIGFAFFTRKMPSKTQVPDNAVAHHQPSVPSDTKQVSPITGDESLQHQGAEQTLKSGTQKEAATAKIYYPSIGSPTAHLRSAKLAAADRLTTISSVSNAFSSSSSVANDSKAIDSTFILAGFPVIVKDEIPLLRVQRLQLLEKETSERSVTAKLSAPLSKKWSFGIETAAMTNFSSRAAGLSIMGIANRPLKMKRLSLEAGLGYAFVQQPLTIVVEGAASPVFENSSLGSNAYYGLEDNVGAFDASTGIVTEYFHALNLHYAIVPLRLHYRMRPRIGIRLGLESGFLLNSDSEYTNGGLLARKNKNSVDQTSGSSNIPTAVLDVAAMGGISYHLSKSWSLQLGYKLGLKDVLPENRYGDYNRMLQAGIRFHCQGKN